MKKLFFLTVIAVSLNAWSDVRTDNTNKNCATAYRTGTKDMVKLIQKFDNKSIDTKQLAALSTEVSVKVSAVRAYCNFVEKPEAKSCSDRYEAIYSDIRSKVSAGALLTGNQTEVEASKAFLVLIEGRLLVADAVCYEFQ